MTEQFKHKIKRAYDLTFRLSYQPNFAIVSALIKTPGMTRDELIKETADIVTFDNLRNLLRFHILYRKGGNSMRDPRNRYYVNHDQVERIFEACHAFNNGTISADEMTPQPAPGSWIISTRHNP